jgi:hypothetical protein
MKRVKKIKGYYAARLLLRGTKYTEVTSVITPNELLI